MRLPADLDLRDAEFERGTPEVDQRRRLHASDAAAHDEDRHKDVRRVGAFDRDLHDGFLAGKFLDEQLAHAFTLYRDQRRRLSERHAHLESRLLARLIALSLGKNVDPVVIPGAKPPLVLARHPDLEMSSGFATRAIGGRGFEDDAARNRRGGGAEQEASPVGLPFACRLDPLHLRKMLVGVETADEALAVRVGLVLEEVHSNRRVRNGLAREVEYGGLEFERVLIAHPRILADPDDAVRGPERDPRGNRLDFAVGVLEFELGPDLFRFFDFVKTGHGGSGGTGAIQSQIEAVDLDFFSLLLRSLISLSLLLLLEAAGDSFADLPVGEDEFIESFEGGDITRLYLMPQPYGKRRGAAAGQIADMEIDGHFRR